MNIIFTRNKIIYNPIQYEKDTSFINQTNYIYYISNLRPKNYNIEELDKMKIKVVFFWIKRRNFDKNVVVQSIILVSAIYSLKIWKFQNIHVDTAIGVKNNDSLIEYEWLFARLALKLYQYRNYKKLRVDGIIDITDNTFIFWIPIKEKF